MKISGSASSATVNIVKDSVKFVRGGELIEGENLTEVYGDITYPDHVIITTKNTPSRPFTIPIERGEEEKIASVPARYIFNIPVSL